MTRHSVLPVLALTLLVPLLATGAASPGAAAEPDPAGRWPLSPRPAVVRSFDPPDVDWLPGHRGVDLAGRVGQPVRAALPGRVAFAGRVAGVGVVVVSHGDSRTTYQPLEPAVGRGTAVSAGTVLGHLQWFGSHCVPRTCLHWGWVLGERYLDPLRLVGGPQQVRLLPWAAPTRPSRPLGTARTPVVRRLPAATPAVTPGATVVCAPRPRGWACW